MATAEHLMEIFLGPTTDCSNEELALRIEIAKLAQLELLNKNLAELGAAIRNRSIA